MSYTDLRDFEAEYTVDVGDMVIEIEKLGGGTLGRAYGGHWRYIVTDSQTGEEIARGQDLHTPIAHTHFRAADLLYSFLTEGDE